MKRLNLGLSFIAALSIYSTANAQSLADALTNGKISGEVTATYENRDFDFDSGTYYRSSAYSVGSFALKYETDIWNDFALTSKFRAYATLFEEDDNSNTGTGKGDASGRFYETGTNKNIDIEELFLSYEPNDNFSIKAGRQFISSYWINKTNDAIKIDANLENTSLEAIWTLRNGRVYSRDYRPVSKVNGDNGVFQIALNHKFNDMFTLSAYDRIEPDVRDIMGAKADAKLGNFSFGIHYASSKEDDSTIKDSNLIHLTASTTILGFTPYAGFIKIDKDAAFPGWTSSGETIDPMEEGDYIYEKDAQTLYLGLSKSFGDLSSTLLYGQTNYLSGTDERKVKETSLWLGYPITKKLSANFGLTNVNEDENSAASDLNQINFTLAYSF